MKPLLAIVGSATWDPFAPIFRDALLKQGIESEVAAFGFGRDIQVLAGSDPDFESRPPQGAFLFFDPVLLFREFVVNPHSNLDPETAARRACDFIVGSLENLANRHRETNWILSMLDPTLPNSGDGIVDIGEDSFSLAVTFSNAALRAACRARNGWNFFDFTRLVRLHGQQEMYDARLDLLARIPLSATGMQRLAKRLAAHWAAVIGKTKKVLALDCDNTLWGGVVGEDGIEGVQIGDDGLGRGYLAFQRSILQLESRGVLLAICSRNNPEDVEEVFARRPEMAIPRNSIAAVHIGWGSKPEGLSALARTLGVGLDSFVFVDDNPAEREEVRQALPEVSVPEFPPDPADLGSFGYALGWEYFCRVRVGDEDRSKTDQYRLKADIETYAEGFADHDAFLKSLEMRLTISVNDPNLLPRAAQLCQKTNQFNLTLKRYNLGQLSALVGEDTTFLFMGLLNDRFGNHGWTALAIIRRRSSQAAWAIDSFLMSCRIIGRGVEQVFLKSCIDYLQHIDNLPVYATFIRGPRNLPASEFLQEVGFEELRETANNGIEFQWSRGTLKVPKAAHFSIDWSVGGK